MLERLGFSSLGLFGSRVSSLGFKALWFRVLGFRALGFRVWGSPKGL